MKKLTLTLLAIACVACSARITSATSSVVYQKVVVYSTPVHVVYADLNDKDVKVTVAISKRGRGSSEPASSIVSRTRPTAAITGTFFDTRTLIPTGDIQICGTRVHSGCVGSALCITKDNQAKVIPCKQRSEYKNAPYETVLQAGPTLVMDGRISMNPRAEGFKDPRLFAATKKTAVGVTATNKIVLVSVNTPVSMRKLAKIVQRLGCTQAILLDGGTSTAMYAGGRFVSRPGRRLTNLLLVYQTAESYRLASAQLAPTLLSRASNATEPVALAKLPNLTPWHGQLVEVKADTGTLPSLAEEYPVSTDLGMPESNAYRIEPAADYRSKEMPADAR